MPKKSSEPESYSVDEMLARLREGEREKKQQDSPGELVVREDGTQVVRVRKRKRRTKQEEKTSKAKRSPLAMLLGVVVVLVVLLGVAVVVMLARYNSSGFRTGVEESVSESSGAKVSFEGLTVTPMKARSKGLTMQWGADRSLTSFSLKGLGADIGFGGFLTGSWGGADVVAQSGELIIGGTTDPAARVDRGDDALFAGYRCDFLDLHVGAPGEGILIKNTELAMREGPEGEQQLHLRGGTVRIPGWSEMEADRGMAEFVDGGLKLISLHLKSKSGEGELVITSESILREGEDVDLRVRITGLPLSSMVGEDLGKLIGGLVTCEDGSLSLDGATLQDEALRMTFSGGAAFISDFVFLEALKTRLTDSEFVRPVFKDIKGTLIRDRNGFRLQDLDLMEKSQLAVRGFLAVDPEGALSGKLEVGIVESKIIAPTGRKRSSVFSDPREGFCWVTINLSGTVEEPSDDFHELLSRAAVEESPRNREKLLEDQLEDLIR